MDLFTLVVPADRLHPNFRHIVRRPEAHIQDVLREWTTGFVDRDGKFVREFQTTFNSSFWELYLFACLKELGLTVDLSHPSPDFVGIEPDMPFCIEASTANHAVNEPAEWLRDISASSIEAINIDHIVQVASLRMANSLTGKHKKYWDTYANLAHVAGRPFVIAVAPFEQPFFYAQNTEAIRKVLYGYEILFENAEEPRGRVMGERYVDAIEKPNGARVPIGVFRQDDMKEISAVIFSNVATYGKVQALSDNPEQALFGVMRYNAHGSLPRCEVVERANYNESLLDGLNVFHNPYAAYPLDRAAFRHPNITQHWFDPIGLRFTDDAREDGLIQRYVISIRANGSGEHTSSMG